MAANSNPTVTRDMLAAKFEEIGVRVGLASQSITLACQALVDASIPAVEAFRRAAVIYNRAKRAQEAQAYLDSRKKKRLTKRPRRPIM